MEDTVKHKPLEFEKCVSCGVHTTDLITTHVDQRLYYVEGAGQLCKRCYNIIYNSFYTPLTYH